MNDKPEMVCTEKRYAVKSIILSRIGFQVFLLTLLITFTAGPIWAQLTTSQKETLAQRFRPYIKMTLDGNSNEQYRTADWQWFVGRSTLVQNYESISCAFGFGTDDVWPDGDGVSYAGNTVTASALFTEPEILLHVPDSDLRQLSSVTVDKGYALHLDKEEDRQGEDWSAVRLGHGFYAHVEEITKSDGTTNSSLVNIEYSILWAYNNAYCSHHNGDITSITVVYDRNADLLTRVTYSVHGDALESFRLARPDSFGLTQLHGQDNDGNPQTVDAMVINVSGINQYQLGSSHHHPSVPFVLLAQDPVSKLFEHPVAYAENGSHELWPNSSGSMDAAPAHNGDGFSYLPEGVHALNTAPYPDMTDTPFLFFNGKFGTDPTSIMMHRTWYWPEGRTDASGNPLNRYGIPEHRFTDPDPYQNMTNSLTWPPQPEYTGANEFVDVNKVSGTILHVFPTSAAPIDPANPSTYVTVATPAFQIDSTSFPFPDPFAAVSFVPCGGTISIKPGNYPASGIFSRQCGSSLDSKGITIVSAGGSVTIGEP